MTQLLLSEFTALETVERRVLFLLAKDPALRSSDKALLDTYYQEVESLQTNLAQTATAPETITRARRLVQSQYPELRAKPEVEEQRRIKQEKYREYYGTQD